MKATRKLKDVHLAVRLAERARSATRRIALIPLVDPRSGVVHPNQSHPSLRAALDALELALEHLDILADAVAYAASKEAP